MIPGEFNFDMNQAMPDHDNPCRLPQYDNAYRVTNEPIVDWLHMIPTIQNARVLTVAASGDQPLMFAGLGASHVDTFDITINACAIMDFKTTALKTLTYPEYKQAVDKLQDLGKMFHESHSNAKLFLNTLNNMPDRTRDLMKKLIQYRPEVFCGSYSMSISIPHDGTTYDQLQKCVTKPFNFIWTNFINLHKYITEQYDIIYLSNIFDHCIWYHYISHADIANATHHLLQHLNDSGRILCASQEGNLVPKILKDRLYLDKIRIIVGSRSYGNAFTPFVIQKIR